MWYFHIKSFIKKTKNTITTLISSSNFQSENFLLSSVTHYLIKSLQFYTSLNIHLAIIVDEAIIMLYNKNLRKCAEVILGQITETDAVGTGAMRDYAVTALSSMACRQPPNHSDRALID